MRYSIIDGFRGYFLVFMMLAHGADVMKSNVNMLSHHSLGWVEDAQGFVFLSGLVMGIVYMRRLQKVGQAGLRVAVRHRLWTIFTHNSGLVVLFTLLALAFGSQAPTLFKDVGLQNGPAGPLAEMLASLLILTGPAYLNILPMYLVFIAISPLALRMILSGRTLEMLGISFALWAFAQTELLPLAMTAATHALGLDQFGVELGLNFNRFAWQLLFFSGLAVGGNMALGKFDPAMFRNPAWTPVARICFALFLFYFVFKLGRYFAWMTGIEGTRYLVEDSRSDLSLIYVINFAADLGLVVWLMIAGRESGNGLVRGVSRGLHWVFTRRPLVFLGQHSLHVYSWHVLVVYVLGTVFATADLDGIARTAIVLAMVASLFIPAWLHARQTDRRRIGSAASPA